MTTHPAFSVVMPARDTATTVGDAIASVLAQTRADFELLVVDDASSDETAAVVESFTDPRVRLVRRETPGGPGAARNEAFAAARAPLVSLLDSDDLWLPDYLDTVEAALSGRPSVGLVCAGHWTLEEPPGLIRRDSSPTDDVELDADTFLLGLVQRNFVVNSTVTVRRSALQSCGGCDTSLTAAVDLDLWLRLASAGYGAFCIGRPLAVYRLRRGSIQHDPRNELRALRNLRIIHEKLAHAPTTPSAARLAARGQLTRIDRRVARLESRSPLVRGVRAARRALGAGRNVALRRRIWYATTPPELAAALPHAVGDGGAG